MSKFDYPPVGFRFKVSFGLRGVGATDASFAEISGISAQVTTEEVTEGGENRFAHRLPTKVTYTPIVLKRGIAPLSSAILTWLFAAISEGFSKPVPCPDMVVQLLDESHQPLMAWNFEGVFPIRYEISGLKADANQIAIETIELQYNRFYVVPV